jgi:translation initiation factor 4G
MSFKDKSLSKIIPDVLKNNPDAPCSIEQPKPKSDEKSDSTQGNSKAGKIRSIIEHENIMKVGIMNKDKMEREISEEKNQEIVLKTAKNPYKRLTNAKLNEQDKLLREVRFILNKMTPNNLKKLTSDLVDLPIYNEDGLKGAVGVIFEASINSQLYASTYAQLCKVLNEMKVPTNADPTKFVLFRTMLLTRCQKEFDTDIYQEISYDKLMQEVESCTDEQKKKDLKEIADDKFIIAKSRYLGNIRFIGELFKFSILTEGILNGYIENLLKEENNEKNIECLCRLLTTTGMKVDNANNAAKMKTYFEKLDTIFKKKDAVSGRIRFMILDVVDLRKNNWVPRHSAQDTTPRNIEEMRKEHEEDMKKEQELIEKQQQEKREKTESQFIKNKDSVERQPPAVINLPERIVLKTVENPYVIKKLTNAELNEQDELLREVRNILNKLTPQNLQKLTSDLINLGINNEDRLKGAIDIIFEKSINDHV